MSHGPIEDKFYERMNRLARELDRMFNRDPGNRAVGFALLVFPFGGSIDQRINYISNANRKDMLDAMKEFIAHAESEPS